MADRTAPHPFVFYGSSSRAAEVLGALVTAERTPSLVVSREVRNPETGGRVASAVTWKAKDLGLPLERVRRAQDRDWLEELEQLAPKLAVEVEFGSRLPAQAIEIPDRGCVALHFSLLPKYRGAEPIRCALSGGESKVGATTFYEDAEAEEDGGDMLLDATVEVRDGDDMGVVGPKVVEAGTGILLETLDKLLAGRKIKRRSQNEKTATRCPKLTKRHLKAPWWLTSNEVANRLRAYTPERGLYTWVKAHRVEVIKGVEMMWHDAPFGDTGTFLGMRTGRIAILCDENTVFGIERVRRKDGEELSARAFADVEDLDIGMQFV